MNTHDLTVCLSFDFDAMSVWVGTVKTTNPADVSRGEYGAYVLPRILSMLERHQVPATFFVPGHTALAFPHLVRDIVSGGHEIGHHGFVHENPIQLDPDEERLVFKRALDILDDVAGVVPIGWRSPGVSYSPQSIDILLEHSMVYDASSSATDFVPYYARVGDRYSATDPYEFGSHVDLVTIPFSWALDDFPHFEFTPGWSTNQTSPRLVREIWHAEYDYARKHYPGGVYTLTMHPQVIGRASRLMMLESLVEEMVAADGVTFSTIGDYATSWRSSNPLEAWVGQQDLRSPT